MLLSPSKCKAMSVTRHQNPLVFFYVIENKPIEPVKSFQYLGITISHDLDWCSYVNNVITSANKKVVFFFKCHL